MANPPITVEEAKQYIELIAAGVNKTDAGKMVGRTAPVLSAFCNRDAELKTALEQAWAQGAEYLIEEARRRGVDGWEEPVFQGGKQVGTVRKYDSNLLMFSIKGRRPEFKENPKIDISNMLAVKFEDRSAALTEMWEVLSNAGVDVQAQVRGGAARKELPVIAGTVAESSDVQRETSGVPKSS